MSRRKKIKKIINESIPANTAFYLPAVPSMDNHGEPPLLRLRIRTWQNGLASRFQARCYSHMVCHILSRHVSLRPGCCLQSAEKQTRQELKEEDKGLKIHKTDTTDTRRDKRDNSIFSLIKGKIFFTQPWCAKCQKVVREGRTEKPPAWSK
jgi:hypothetical protein